MRKTLVPMLVSLALCGVATTALIAGGARAQTARDAGSAAPPSDGGGRAGMRMPSPAELAARHKQFCQDAYAHQVGDLAYLEAKLSLTPAQQPLFDRWKSTKLDIAKRGEADCTTRELPSRTQGKSGPSPLDAMMREEDNLKRRIADLDAERPVLGAFYASLTQSQKMALTHPGPEAMTSRHLMFSDAISPRLERRSGAPGAGPMPDGPPPQ